MTRIKAFSVEVGWQLILKQVNIEPIDLLKHARLPEELFHQRQPRLSTEDYFRFWESMEALANNQELALMLIESFSVEAFSPPLFAALCSQNLVSAFKRISAYKKLIAPIAMQVAESDYELTLSLNWQELLHTPPLTLAVTELLFFVSLARTATRERIEPVRLTLPQPPSPSKAYEEFLGVPITKSETYSVVFSMRDATRPFLTANESMWEIFEPNFRKSLSELEASTTTHERVRAVLLEALPSGACNIDEVSKRLAMGKRTLQRRLRDEDTRFQIILDQTREELARHYLRETSLSSTEISFLLGFEEPNSFYRAFHGWTGHTPDQMRRLEG